MSKHAPHLTLVVDGGGWLKTVPKVEVCGGLVISSRELSFRISLIGVLKLK